MAMVGYVVMMEMEMEMVMVMENLLDLPWSQYDQ